MTAFPKRENICVCVICRRLSLLPWVIRLTSLIRDNLLQRQKKSYMQEIMSEIHDLAFHCKQITGYHLRVIGLARNKVWADPFSVLQLVSIKGYVPSWPVKSFRSSLLLLGYICY